MATRCLPAHVQILADFQALGIQPIEQSRQEAYEDRNGERVYLDDKLQIGEYYEVDLNDRATLLRAGTVATLDSSTDKVSRFFLSFFATSRFACIKNWAEAKLERIGRHYLRCYYRDHHDDLQVYAKPQDLPWAEQGRPELRPHEKADVVLKFRIYTWRVVDKDEQPKRKGSVLDELPTVAHSLPTAEDLASDVSATPYVRMEDLEKLSEVTL